MKLLHTSDWHVGKTIRGQSRLDEHAAVLAEIVRIAGAEQVDVAIIAGDLYETAAPAPEATKLVLRALLDLRAVGAEVVVIAGNHDNQAAFEALRPLAAEAGITIRGQVARAEDGGVLEFSARTGEPVRIALVPFCSQRSVIRSAELLAADAAANAGAYAERLAAVITSLTTSFRSAEAVNLVAAHCMVRGGRLGGGERDAQTVEDYYVDPTSFGSLPHYVALGHLHLTQRLPGGCPIWYSGSPIQVDFGEEGDDKHVLVVEMAPGVPASQPRKVALTSPRRLRTLRGSIAELEELAGTTGEDFLRIFVREKAHAGLADSLRALFPHAVDVRIEATSDDPAIERNGALPHGPHELFAAYLASRDVEDPRVEALFGHLLEEETAHERGEPVLTA